jgi:hypothetical protein
MIGIFGLTPPIVFGSGPTGIMTFDNFQKITKQRFAVHDVHLQTPIVEYTGPDLTQVTFTMNFMYSNPQITTPPNEGIAQLEALQGSGQPQPLIIGCVPVGSGMSTFVIEELLTAVKYWGPGGTVMGASVTVKLLQYGSLLNSLGIPSIAGFSFQ